MTYEDSHNAAECPYCQGTRRRGLVFLCGYVAVVLVIMLLVMGVVSW